MRNYLSFFAMSLPQAMCASKDIAAIGAQKPVQFFSFPQYLLKMREGTRIACNDTGT
jgi:hypothetical protein